MSKKIIILFLALVLLVSIVTPHALAAITDEQQQKIDSIHQRMEQYRYQLIDIYLEAGLITEEQAQLAKERVELRAKKRAEYGCGLGIGLGQGRFSKGQGIGGPCMLWSAN